MKITPEMMLAAKSQAHRYCVREADVLWALVDSDGAIVKWCDSQHEANMACFSWNAYAALDAAIKAQ